MNKILVLGGTNFIGRNLVDTLIHRPDLDITLLNRGKTNSGLYLNIRTIYGRRNAHNTRI